MTHSIHVLLVEDSLADSTLILEVFKEQNIAIDSVTIRDGEAAMRYLRKEAEFQNAKRPDMIILDLNLPKKDGREVLAEIKNSSELKSIPVIILTTSQAPEDISKSYNLQASCYLSKPLDLNEFIKLVKSIDDFWFSAVLYAPRK